jgi:hypothetical protein
MTETNPYIIDHERIAFAWLLFTADGDVLARLILKLSPLPVVTKADAMDLVLAVAAEMRQQAGTRTLPTTANAARAVRRFEEDLGVGSRRGRSRGPSSTVWHRVSSRLEALTDLGLLEKADSLGHARPFDYIYRPTSRLQSVGQTLQYARAPSEWVDLHLAGSLGTSSHGENDAVSELFDAVRLSLGPTGVHIDSFAVIAASLAGMRGKVLQLGRARDQLKSLAVRHPDIVRLSRGYSGPRAEFASVTMRKLEDSGPSIFAE